MRVTDLAVDKTQILRLVDKYEALIDVCQEDITFIGKTLEDANREQPELVLKYHRALSECEGVLKFMNGQMDKTRSILYKQHEKESSKLLTDRTIEKYIDSEQVYLDQFHLWLEIKHIRDQLAAIVEALKTRGFALRNITEARVNSVHNAVL